jgi:hypothetical protein
MVFPRGLEEEKNSGKDRFSMSWIASKENQLADVGRIMGKVGFGVDFGFVNKFWNGNEFGSVSGPEKTNQNKNNNKKVTSIQRKQ